MKIVHIAPNAPYNEGWGYQDNLLPKYHARLGHDVTLIITNRTHCDGNIVETDCETSYSPDGFRVVRRKNVMPHFLKLDVFFSKINVYDILEDIKPDFVFYHGLVSSTIFQVTYYKRHVNPDMVIVQDNHLDYNIGFGKKMSLWQKILVLKHRLVYAMNDKYISKVYGVTPWRKDYAIDVFGVPSKKADILIMGADDDQIDLQHRHEIRENLRKQYNVKDSDFLIVSGGKIDRRKKIDLLMRAVAGQSNTKLLVFGNVLDDIKDDFDQLVKENENIIYIGWIDSAKVYDYFFAADLVFFPGQHSVLWEQACASKVPCVFERWEGMDHVNNGGNSDFVSPVTVDSLKAKIEELKFTPKYFKMKSIAESEKTDIYLYSKIAEKSLECAKEICV